MSTEKTPRLPVVAIVGRPNVGKSALFNRIARRRIAIVEPTHGVTRDRISSPVEVGDRTLELVDTGGITHGSSDSIARQIQDQVRLAIEQSDVLLFVVDVQEGPTARDREVANILREHSKPVILVANKADTRQAEAEAVEFFELGFGEATPVSALHGVGPRELIEKVAEILPETSGVPPAAHLFLALIGRRNVGKSTYVNALARQDRMIVSEVPGTTRDSVDIRFERDGKVYVAIDTAGLRKKGKMDDAIEFFGRVRAEESVRRADVCLLMIDGRQGIVKVDKKSADLISKRMKPCVIVINKWDLADPSWTMDHVGEQVSQLLPGIRYAPLVFMSALKRENILAPLRMAEALHEQGGSRASTAAVNRIIRAAFEERSPKARGGVPGKVYFAIQVGTYPPHFLVFVNRREIFDRAYQRYLINRLRESLPCAEIPLRLTIRDHARAEKR